MNPTAAASTDMERHRPLLAELSRIWSTPGLEGTIRIVPTSRMTRTLARAYPTTGLVRISTRVLESGSEDLIREIVSHEAAHVACRLKHGPRVRAHGREWKDLMRQAGFQPRIRIDCDAILPAAATSRRPFAYEHNCPACGWTRPARTTNRRWRCAACLRAGRKGLLLVTRLPIAGTAR